MLAARITCLLLPALMTWLLPYTLSAPLHPALLLSMRTPPNTSHLPPLPFPPFPPALPRPPQAMRLFVGAPVWTPFNRPQEDHPSRVKYLQDFKTEAEAVAAA